jgi:uncharacterized membrane protein YuzA (DUF378 family)
MADDKNKIIKEVSDELEAIDLKISGIAQQFQNKISDSVIKAKDLNDAFKNGEEILKRTTSERRKINSSIEASLRAEAKLEDQILKAKPAKIAGLQLKLKELVAQRELNEDLDANLYKLLKAAELEKQITEEKKKQNTAQGVAKKLYDDNFKKTVETFTTLEGIFKLIIDASLLFNRISTDISKNFGTITNDSDKLTYDLLNVAQSSNNVNVTLKSAGEAMSQLSEQTGFVAEYSAETLKTQIMLTKQFGLTAEEAAGIYKFSVLTGKSAEQVNKSMVGAYVAARNQLGVGIPFRATMAEAAKVSGQLAANLKNNPEFIVKAVAQAKALGTTLEQTKKQGESLLEFESSLEAELKAELLTGQALNLERARAAALMGDQVTVMKELNSQEMTFEKFQTMNVLAQRSFAAAIGLSADELANQLRLQKLAVESGKSLVQITEEEALEAQKRQTIQDKFNAGIDKLKDIVGNLLTGPVSQLLDAITNVVYLVGLIGKPFAYVNDLIDKFAGKASLISGVLKTIVGILGVMAIRAAVFSAIMNPITAIAGLAIAGIAATAAKSLIPEMAEGGVVPATPGGKIVKVAEAGQAEAIIPLNRLNNMMAPKQDNTALITAINRQTDVISSKNYTPTLQTVIGGSVIATATTQNSYNLA